MNSPLSMLEHSHAQSDVALSEGEVRINQVNLDYHTEAGNLALNRDDPAEPVTTLSYVACFKMMDKKEKKDNRPITFIYNGDLSSSSV
ncbi:MAG: hypothetical protein ACSLEN_02930 [Candidatus Malihini olakiniferum]